MTADSTNTTLWHRWAEHARLQPDGAAVVHWVAGEEPFTWTWAALIGRAARYAAALKNRGVRKGQVCATVLRHHREFYPLYMGIESLGALPAVLAYPNPRLHPDKFRQGLEGIAHNSGLDWLLTQRELEPTVRPLATGEKSTIRDVLFPLDWDNGGELSAELKEKETVDPSEPCLLQHSSGTTGLQKAIMLSHRAVLEHVERYGKALGMSRADKVVSWLPLYHDMGLIAAFHLPLAFGIPTVQMDPFEWVLAPVLLLEAISAQRGTLTWLPNFAYNLMADRIHDEDLAGLRLDSLRMAINCSEPVRAGSHEKFLARFAALGLSPGALATSYAMAETTFAVTQSAPGNPPPALPASRQEMSRGRYAPPAADEATTRCLSSGTPISGCHVRVVDEKGNDVPDGRIGEIVIRSVSMFDGYRNNPEKTRLVLKDGSYCSGDYGFALDGQLYVIGRKKDIIIVAGKNLYPEDIEEAVSGVPGVIPGRVVAFGAEDESAGTEQICVVVETNEGDAARRKALRLAIVEAAMGIDVTVSRVYLAPPRWLIKSSAGKPSRSANRQRTVDELKPE
jgi:acyl-CoA synthetase (AMP-forming)/AMP-acid ligase II